VEVFPIPFVRVGLTSSFGTLGTGLAADQGHDAEFRLLSQLHLYF
jgi:hypothetical protein